MSARCSSWRLAVHRIIGLGLLDCEERTLAYTSEMQLLRTHCAQGNRTRSFRLWGESPCTCQRDAAPLMSLLEISCPWRLNRQPDHQFFSLSFCGAGICWIHNYYNPIAKWSRLLRWGIVFLWRFDSSQVIPSLNLIGVYLHYGVSSNQTTEVWLFRSTRKARLFEQVAKVDSSSPIGAIRLIFLIKR